jgi:hypothetical protein
MCRVQFPESFSPVGQGLCRLFAPRVSNASDTLLFNMIISNQRGEVVYEAYQVQDGWDGSCRGLPCPKGTYQYNATILEKDKHPSFQFQKTGFVRLER